MDAEIAVVAGEAETVGVLRRLAAAAGAGIVAAHDPFEIQGLWRTAPAVVLDVASAEAVAQLALPRRDAVVLVDGRPPDAAAWRAAARLGAGDVLVVPGQERELVELIAEAVEGPGRAGRVVGVRSGHGGAGASTLTVLLAGVVATGAGAVTVVDGDPAGGGLDLLLGAERLDGLRWPALAEVRGRITGRALLDRLPVVDGVSVLSHGRGSPAEPASDAAVGAVLAACRRGGAPTIVDLPRQAAAAATTACDTVVVVAEASVRGTAAAACVVDDATRHGGDVRLVVRRTSRAGLRPADVGRALGFPVAAALPAHAAVAAAADRGELLHLARRRQLAGPLRDVARELGLLT